MTVLSRSTYVLAVIDALIIAFVTFVNYMFVATSYSQIFGIIAIFITLTMILLGAKGFYNSRKYGFKDFYKLFEGIFISAFLAGLITISIIKVFSLPIVLFNLIFVFAGITLTRVFYVIFKLLFKPVKNILIVGAGQDGKLIAEEIQSRPELGMKVVGFLDDNMNNIEEEDSTIPILGLTYDSEAVIKDNNVDMVIILRLAFWRTHQNLHQNAPLLLSRGNFVGKFSFAT